MSNTKDTGGDKSKPEGGMSDSDLDQVSGGVLRGPGTNPFANPLPPKPTPNKPIIYPNRPGVLK